MKALTFKFLLLTTILVLSSNVVFGQFDWTKDREKSNIFWKWKWNLGRRSNVSNGCL